MAALQVNSSVSAAPPTDQRRQTKPISFYLMDASSRPITSTSVTLNVRPEELTRTDPSRINPQQTLGGTPWADCFGPGLPTITIAGHTGWRRPLPPAIGTDDGFAVYQNLRSTVF